MNLIYPFAFVALACAAVQPLAAQCIDYSKDPAGCQPSTFDTPMGTMPSVRVNAKGEIDPKASEADARIGAALLEEKLHLFRNLRHIHWVLTVPSVPRITKPHRGCGWMIHGSVNVPQRVSNFDNPCA